MTAKNIVPSADIIPIIRICYSDIIDIVPIKWYNANDWGWVNYVYYCEASC